VSKILPDDFVLPDPYLTEQVTIEDILSHRSGLACHDESYLSVRSQNPDDALSLTRNLRNLEFVKPLRSGFIYCNIMYSVATLLVEKVSGMAYAEFLRKKIWEPLGMRNTFHDLPDIEAHGAMERKATPYYFDRDQQKHVSMPSYPQPEGYGAGCIFSSAGDYAKFVRALIHHSPPWSKDTHKDFVTPRSIYYFNEKYAIPMGSRPLYCMGLVNETYRGYTVMSHCGSVPGFKALFTYLPEFDWGIVMFGNSDDADMCHEVVRWTALDDVLGVPQEQRTDWSKFFRGWDDGFQEKAKEIPGELIRPEDCEPLGVELEDMVGTYRDKGYKDLVLEIREGKLVADCNDRCFPSILTFYHLTGQKFRVEMYGPWDGQTRRVRGEIRVEDGKVTAVGVEFEEDVKGGLIWFKRVETVDATLPLR
jgi:CubicO group peptidase (beta-lactamase class C family)